MFLTEGNYKCDDLKVSETEYNIVTNVLIWNNQGAAVIYGILQLGNASYARALFQVPQFLPFLKGIYVLNLI